MSDSNPRRIAYFLALFCLILFPSCAEKPPAIPQPSAEYVVMINEGGPPENILMEQFFKNKEHADGVKVLVVDKQSKAHVLITPAELLKQNPNAGRYLIFKHDDPKRPFDDVPR